MSATGCVDCNFTLAERANLSGGSGGSLRLCRLLTKLLELVDSLNKQEDYKSKNEEVDNRSDK